MKLGYCYLCVLVVISAVYCEFSLEEYEELEQETPQYLFEPMKEENFKQNTPNMKKIIFVTPWNIEGGDLVIKYAKKFDYVSPCWYDLSFNEDHIIIENDRLFNYTFIDLVKKANPQIKLVPRFYISSQQKALLHSIGSFESKFKQAINLVVNIVERFDFDGLVWDSPFNTMIAGQQYTSIRNLILQLVNSIRMNLLYTKTLIFNMANPHGRKLATQMYSILKVDAILIQNYDNDLYEESIQSSISWINQLSSKRNQKTIYFLLLPFFSRMNGQGIDSKQIMRMYQNQKNVASAIKNGICVFYSYSKRIQAHTPCYTYFKRAFKRIEDEKLNVGFWEAGNGLEIYYSFL